MTIEKKTDQPIDEPFLARWSRVKQSGDAAALPANPESSNTSIGGHLEPKKAGEARPEPTLPVAVPLPSLDNMTPQSDFSPFMAKDVDPQLRNLAMKKLFTDPHYNVMDRLDIYIDDYSTHAPLPLDVIRRMSISKALRLFDDDEEDGDTANVAALEPSLPAPMPAASTIVAPHATPDGAIVHRDPESVAGNAVDQAPAGKTL